jgi:tetratricopeptide (TPR) repeat protein
VLGTAADVAYMRGDSMRANRLARAGLEQATDADGRWHCLSSLSLADLIRGAYADSIEHALAATALQSRPSETIGVAALAAAYGGDLDQARELSDQMTATATSPTLRGFAAYVAGEIDSASGRREQAEEHYARAIDLAHSSGATFLDGIATIGLLTQRVDAGRIDDALGGYRDVIDYFARTGNWTHQWTTLRNLAHLLRQLGDHEPATLLDAAADQAPDAPAIGPTPTPTATKAPPSPPQAPPRPPAISRAHALAVAQEAIERNPPGP